MDSKFHVTFHSNNISFTPKMIKEHNNIINVATNLNNNSFNQEMKDTSREIQAKINPVAAVDLYDEVIYNGGDLDKDVW